MFAKIIKFLEGLEDHYSKIIATSDSLEIFSRHCHDHTSFCLEIIKIAHDFHAMDSLQLMVCV